MKTFKKSYLPDSVTYKGIELTLNSKATTKAMLNDMFALEANYLQKIQGKTVCIVEVMHKGLKGRTDLHFQPYKPNVYIFSN